MIDGCKKSEQKVLRMSILLAKVSKILCGLAAVGLLLPAMAFGHPAFKLLGENGMPVKDQLDPSDTVRAANGSVYMRGPAYSPKQTCGKCHDYNAITQAYHFREGAGPDGENLSDLWSVEHKNDTLYKGLANSYGYLISPGQLGAW